MIQGREFLKQVAATTPFKPALQLKQQYGLDELLRLGANENPLGPSPAAIQAMTHALGESQYYPDAGNLALQARLSERLEFPADHIVVEAGISGLLRVALEAFIDPGQQVVFPWPTFAIYPLITTSLGGSPIAVPLLPDLQVDWAGLAKAAKDARMVWVCNPNNPTGRGFGLDPLRQLCQALPPNCLLVVDEAYIEFSDDESALPLVREGHPVIVMRTFSKAYGIAGLRVGYAITRPDIADWFHRSREQFQVNSVGQAGALAALDDSEHLRRSVEVVRAGREYLRTACADLAIEVIPSSANFMLLRIGLDCRPLADALLRQGVMTRATDTLFDLPGCLRVTVGTPEMNQRFVAVLTKELHHLRHAGA